MKYLSIFILLGFFSFNYPKPSLVLKINWKTPQDTLHLKHFRNHELIKHKFLFVTEKNPDESFVEILDTEGNLLGTFWGRLTPNYLIELLPSVETQSEDMKRAIK
jgi:hypothetical protein